jgi:hypothetical protein
MYIIADSQPYLSSSVAVSGSELCMSTKCNALAVETPISAAIPTYSMSIFFLFLSFSIISLHSTAAEPAFFAKIRRLGDSEPRLDRNSTKNMVEFGLNLAKFAPMFPAASHDIVSSLHMGMLTGI